MCREISHFFHEPVEAFCDDDLEGVVVVVEGL